MHRIREQATLKYRAWVIMLDRGLGLYSVYSVPIEFVKYSFAQVDSEIGFRQNFVRWPTTKASLRGIMSLVEGEECRNTSDGSSLVSCNASKIGPSCN